MPSSSSTAHLGLNQWAGSDSPKMADFNADNQKIDEAVEAHFGDTVAHLGAGERQGWNNAVPLTGSYVGNGEEERVIDVGFPPSFGVVYAVGKNIVSAQGASGNMLVHTAFISKDGCSEGAAVTGNLVTLYQLEFVVNNRIALLNLPDTTYVYIFFR